MIISNEVEELPVESQSSETNKKLTTKVFTNNKQIIIDWRCYLDYKHVARETYSKNLHYFFHIEESAENWSNIYNSTKQAITGLFPSDTIEISDSANEINQNTVILGTLTFLQI